MSIIIDIVIIAVILLCLYGGYRKGLIGLAFSIVSFVAALIIAFILFSPISTFVINNTEFDDNVKQAIVSNFNSEKSGSTENSENLEASNGATGENLKSGTSNFISEYIDEQIDETKGKTIEIVATEISQICIKGIVFIALFIIARIVLIFFRAIADLIAKLPILNQFNKLGGIVFGLLKGLVITYGVLAVLLLVSPMFENAAFFNELNNSTIGGMMYNNNIIVKMIF